jgi:hypothetical protein
VADEPPLVAPSDEHVAEPRSVWRPALTLSDEGSVSTGLPSGSATGANIALVQPSLSYRYCERIRAVASVSGILLTEGESSAARIRSREAYAGFTAGDWDLALGKKMLRWSNGYAFAPAGALDPPRRVTDPTDRLSLSEGRGVALASLVHGRHSFTLAWASAGLVERSRPGLREVTALRYDALFGGVDTSLILAYRRGLGPFLATTFTAVLGSNLEVHGDAALGLGTESLSLPGSVGSFPLGDDRRVALLVGTKLSLPYRVTAIVELHTADGLIPLGAGSAVASTTESLGALSSQGHNGQLPTERRHYGFIHLGKSRLSERPGWRDWDAGGVLLLGLSDGGRMLILDVEHRVGLRFAIHGRLSLSGGPAQRSEYGMIPWTSQASLSLRFQM